LIGAEGDDTEAILSEIETEELHRLLIIFGAGWCSFDAPGLLVLAERVTS
jgi:hypothetical protein